MMPTFLQNNQSIAIDAELTTTTCWCGIHLAVPSNLYRWAQNGRNRAIFCPLGHEFIFGDNEVKRERRKREEAERDAAFWRSRNRESQQEIRNERRRAAAIKGHLTRLRNRVAAGVCPVAGCKRSFENVHRHLETEHAEWLAAHAEVVDAE